MQQQLENRLQTLKDEFASGQKVLAEMEKKQTDLQHTMLRISGAIQVLEELQQEMAEQPDALSMHHAADGEKPVATVHSVAPSA